MPEACSDSELDVVNDDQTDLPWYYSSREMVVETRG